MKKIAISLLSLTIGLTLNAQDIDNLVENPGFEQTEGKIKRAGSINVAIGWMSPTKTGADLFSSKVKEGFGTPNNMYGEEAPEGDGGNYVGIRTYSFQDKEPRQYISAKLKETMRKDALYCVKFYVSLAEGSKYAANNLGVNFSKKQYNIDEDKSILAETHIMHKDNPVFNAYFGWDEVCGVYQATGGEKFITIGNFSTTGETQTERLRKLKNSSATSVTAAYYFIDNISVVMIDDESECDCRADQHEVETLFVFETTPVDPEGMDDDMIVKYSELYFAYGNAELNANDKAHIANIELVMKRNSAYKVKIFAHMDADEATDGDLIGLDQDRAETVKKHLIDNGIDASRIIIVTKGDTEPRNTDGTEEGHAMNRRIIFELVK